MKNEITEATKQEAWSAAALATQILEPGIYVLTQDVVNPRPDRRAKYDWRKLPSWKKGTRFIVTEAQGGKSHPWPAMLRKQTGYGEWRLDSEEAATILEYLTPAGRNLRALLEGGGSHYAGEPLGNAMTALTVLVARGLVSLKDVEEAMNAPKEEREAADKCGGWIKK